MRGGSRWIMLLAGMVFLLLMAGGTSGAEMKSQTKQDAKIDGCSSGITLPLWPVGTDDVTDEAGEDTSPKQEPIDRYITDIGRPTLTVFPVRDGRKTHAGVVICPGGGYILVAIDKEGYNIARWLNSQGIAAFVLKYRLPKPVLKPEALPYPLLDAGRAIRMVREGAAQWGVDPQRIGIMGFSAGGHVASTAATHFGPGHPDSADPIERLSSRPDFAVLVYPVVSMLDKIVHQGSREQLLGKTPNEQMVKLYSNELQVTPRTPPTFLVHAKDDGGVPVENSIRFAEALKKAGVPYSLTVFEKGGHGFALGQEGGEPATWPAQCIGWLKENKFVNGPAG